MTGANILFVAIAAAALVGGLALLVSAVTRHKANSPRHVAMLIGGMMATAFGLLLGGFVIAYASGSSAR